MMTASEATNRKTRVNYRVVEKLSEGIGVLYRAEDSLFDQSPKV